MTSEGYLENKLYTKAAQRRIPISGTFELLPVCNLDCKMCYVKKSMAEVNQAGGLRSADEWIALGRKAVDAGMLFLLLTGGEPFLYKDFEKVYTAFHKMGLAIDINSNGTMITEEHIKWLSKCRPRHVKISLYGASRESYQKLCGNGEAFDKTIRAFQMLKDAGITVYSSITVTPGNYSELDEMISLCEKYEIPVKATSYMFPPLRSAQMHIHEKYRLSPKEAADATMRIAKRLNDEDAFYERAALYAGEEYQNYKKYLSECSECGSTTCRAGYCTFWVTWEGKMVPCAMMDFGNFAVMDGMDFDEAWKKTQEIIHKVKISPECSSCKAKKACYSCAASAYCETGSTQGKPEYVCQMTAEYLKIMHEEYLNHQ